MAIPLELQELLRDATIKLDPVTLDIHVISLTRPLSQVEILRIATYKDVIRDFYTQNHRAWRITLIDGKRAYMYTEVLHTVAQAEADVIKYAGNLTLAVEPMP